MSVALKVDVRGFGRVQRMIRSLPKHLEEEVGESNFRFANVVKRSLKNQLMRTSQRFRKKIYNGIRAEKKSNFRSEVWMPIEGIYLDRMSPHVVALKRGRLITEWAREKGIKSRYITVKPHPFIDVGVKNSLRKLPVEVRSGVDRAIARSRK